jgi:hypothetical protein
MCEKLQVDRDVAECLAECLGLHEGDDKGASFAEFLAHFAEIQGVRRLAREAHWKRCIGIGVAGNVAGHMEMAGEAEPADPAAAKEDSRLEVKLILIFHCYYEILIRFRTSEMIFRSDFILMIRVKQYNSNYLILLKVLKSPPQPVSSHFTFHNISDSTKVWTKSASTGASNRRKRRRGWRMVI